jgi:hypothetical protein
VKKRLLSLIFRLSNGAVDIESRSVTKRAVSCNCPLEKRIEITCILSAPLFWRRRTCAHSHAKRHGLIRNGLTYCTACEQQVSAV